MQYVQILKDFIRAERTGNFAFHLQTVGKMLNLFAATGHIHYAKSGRFYLQQMLELETKYPLVCAKFIHQRYHAIRHTDKYWNGLLTDLINEQVLIRSLKSCRSLTWTRGIAECRRTILAGTMLGRAKFMMPCTMYHIHNIELANSMLSSKKKATRWKRLVNI